MRNVQEFLDQLPKLPDLPRAWLLLLLSASPRASRAIRTLHLSAFAHTPGDMMMPFSQRCRACSAARAVRTPSVPGKLPPCRARWAASDCRPPRSRRLQLTGPLGRTRCLRARLPHCAANYVQLLEDEARDGAHCLAETAHARRTLQDQGWSACFAWRRLLDVTGRRSPRPASSAGCRGLAAWLAVPRIADPYRALSRSRAPATLAAQFARSAPLPSRTAC